MVFSNADLKWVNVGVKWLQVPDKLQVAWGSNSIGQCRWSCWRCLPLGFLLKWLRPWQNSVTMFGSERATVKMSRISWKSIVRIVSWRRLHRLMRHCRQVKLTEQRHNHLCYFTVVVLCLNLYCLLNMIIFAR